MDKKTFDAYEQNAKAYSDDWLSQPVPSDMYDLLKKYFQPSGTTADVGCGNGRDTYWLSQNGFKPTGFDASKALLNIASELYPQISFTQANFPQLSEISEEFDNILCETVIMHLQTEQIPAALQSLKRILKPGGVLYLSWRATEGESARHADGRLYSAFDTDSVLREFAKEGVLHFEDKLSASSGKRVCRLLWKK